MAQDRASVVDARISIVMPVHNEEGAIARTVLECRDAVLSRFREGEIVCVDDASSDGTREQLRSLGAQLDSLRVHRNERNLGHGSSLRKALELATGDLVFAIDSDYQIRPGDFWLLYRHHAPDAIVLGTRRPRRDGRVRRAISDLASRGICSLYSAPACDLNTPFKLFPAAVLDRLLPLLPERPAIPSTLLILAAHRCGIPVRETAVEHFARSTGSNWLTAPRLARFSVAVIAELIRFRRTLAAAGDKC